MADAKVSISFRLIDEHDEAGITERFLQQARSHGMSPSKYARQKLIQSLDDDRLDHISALLQQLHSKVRQLEQATDQLRKNQKKGIMAILIHVCDLTPDQAQRLLSGEPPL